MTHQKTVNVIYCGLGLTVGCIVACLMMIVEARFYEQQIEQIKIVCSGTSHIAGERVR